MPTSLPQHDPQSLAREAERARARETYRYTWHQPEGVASAAEVPNEDGFGAKYLAQYGTVVTKLTAHKTAVVGKNRVAEALDDESGSTRRLRRLQEALGDLLGESNDRATPEIALRWFGEDVPTFVATRHEQPERDDALFAWQRLGGANPMSLRAVQAVPECVPVDEAVYAKVIGGGDSLARALADGRLFVCDWGWLAGAHTGVTDEGEAKRVYPAAALFAQVRDAELMPVAIRCAPGQAILTPADGVAWSMAKLVAQTADLHEQALIWHLGHCHFLMEAFALATRRELADAHPIKRLLIPHTQFTLAINQQVRDTLMKPSGDLETLLAMTLGQSLWAVADGMRRFDYAAVLPPTNVARRGLGDPATLRHCPLRDDGLDLWASIHAFVSEYLGLYYQSDADVADDSELRAWTADLRGHWGGRLTSIPDVATRDELVDLVAFVLWSAGPFHTICNYSQFEMMSDSTNMPAALFGQPPRIGATDRDLYNSYLPEKLSMAQWAFFFEQTQLHENTFGSYPPGSFDDPRVAPIAERFRTDLDGVDARIVERNAARPSTYEWLRPARTRASIHS